MEVSAAAIAALFAKAWLIIAALVGALTGAWLQRPVSRKEYFASVLIAFCASVFVAPAILSHFLPNAPADSPIVAATYWAVSTLAMGVIPALRKRLGTVIESWKADK